MNLKELYNKLPEELKIFFEYLLPSVLIAFGIDYLTKLEVNNVFLALGVNIGLIFLRQIKPRYERLKK